MLSRLSRPVSRLAASKAVVLQRPALASFSSIRDPRDPPPSSSYPWEKGAWNPNSGYPVPLSANNGDDHVSVINQYGWRPFVGGLAGLLLFKEVHALKEESCLALLTLTGFYIAYIAAGDKLVEGAAEEQAKKQKLLANLSACEMAGLEMYMQKLKLPASLPPLLESMATEHKEVAERWVAAKNASMRVALARETLERLEKLKQSEEALNRKKQGNLNAAAIQNVVGIFEKKDEKLQKEMLDWSLSVAGSVKPGKVATHPVVKAFNKAFSDLGIEQKLD